jgi:phosphinothricin acetyltransferase
MLRHADPARDGAACAEIYAPYVRDTAVSLEDSPPDGAEMARRIEQYGATHAWLVAELDDRVNGFAYACPHRARAGYRWAADVAVYVNPDRHRRGIGRELYAALFELLRSQGLYVAVAGITLPNAASIGLHESLGFVRVGTYSGIGFKAGAWRDVEWWQLQLAAPGEAPPGEPLAPQRLG